MEDEEDTLCKYGTPLPAYEEDEVPSKKPILIEDQIVLDENGKRRFHGAFTGGFSAGYWNTVGSEAGWTPTEFKSSRSEKASVRRAQQPMDFMDDEDLGEFGIAPQRVQAKEDFAQAGSSKSGSKRRLPAGNWSGPIPGQPVLKALLEPAREKTAVKMLKRMGWREGQGIGERQSRIEKKKANERNKQETYVMKMYGCALPGKSTPEAVAVSGSSDSESDQSDYEVSFAPDDFDPLVAAVKENTFGLGYSGLERSSTSSQRFNLFDTLEIVDRNNKKLSIRGQAFGIGALEDDDDEDVYAKDDMSRYDFSLEDKAKKPAAIKSADQAGVLEGFCSSKKSGKQSKRVFKVSVPDGFVPRDWTQRRSRFEPVNEQRLQQFNESNQYKVQGLGRHDLNPEERDHALGETASVSQVPKRNPLLEMINKRSDNFVSGETINADNENRNDLVKNDIVKKDPLKFDLKAESSNLGSTKDGFKPFIADPDKQERYDKYLAFKACEKYPTKEEFLSSLQPLGMSSWDREREVKEFAQAQRMYRPLDGLMSDRFVTESNLIAEKVVQEATTRPGEIKMRRTRTMWKPHKDLCKRFNVPEPFSGMMADEEPIKTKGKFSVFDYLEAPVNSRSDFVTPVVIPKHAAKEGPKPVRTSAKEFFSEQPSSSTAQSEKLPQTHQPRLQSSSSIAAAAPRKVEKRTPLEQQVLDSVNKKPEEKKDLFKSIFCSSDEEDDPAGKPAEPQQAAPASETEKLKLVESLVAIKPASQVNILRNNSPPRGIFASIFEIKKPPPPVTDDRPEAVAVDSSSSSESEKEDDAFYGPKLPTSKPEVDTKVVSTRNPAGTAEHQFGKQNVAREVVEEWVEKDGHSSSKSKKKKHKEHKKSKKHKKDKKKHKSKSKR